VVLVFVSCFADWVYREYKLYLRKEVKMSTRRKLALFGAAVFILFMVVDCSEEDGEDNSPTGPVVSQSYVVGGVYRDVENNQDVIGVSVVGPMIPWVTVNGDTIPFHTSKDDFCTYWDSAADLTLGNTYNLKVDFLEYGSLTGFCILPGAFSLTPSGTYTIPFLSGFNGTWTESGNADWYLVNFRLSYEWYDNTVVEGYDEIGLEENGPIVTYDFGVYGEFSMRYANGTVYISAPGGVVEGRWDYAPGDEDVYEDESVAEKYDNFAVITSDIPHYAKINIGYFDYTGSDGVTVNFSYYLQSDAGNRHISYPDYQYIDTLSIVEGESFPLTSDALFPGIESADSIYAYSSGYFSVTAFNGPIPQPGSYGNISGNGYGFFLGGYFPERTVVRVGDVRSRTATEDENKSPIGSKKIMEMLGDYVSGKKEFLRD